MPSGAKLRATTLGARRITAGSLGETGAGGERTVARAPLNLATAAPDASHQRSLCALAVAPAPDVPRCGACQLSARESLDPSTLRRPPQPQAPRSRYRWHVLFRRRDLESREVSGRVSGGPSTAPDGGPYRAPPDPTRPTQGRAPPAAPRKPADADSCRPTRSCRVDAGEPVAGAARPPSSRRDRPPDVRRLGRACRVEKRKMGLRVELARNQTRGRLHGPCAAPRGPIRGATMATVHTIDLKHIKKRGTELVFGTAVSYRSPARGGNG